VFIFVLFYAFFLYGIAPLTGMLTGTYAPLPSSLVPMYAATVGLAILLYLSVQESRWANFIGPVLDFLRDPEPTPVRRNARTVTLVLIPLLIGGRAYLGASAEPEPPTDPPGIHFDLPNKYKDLENPLGSFEHWKAEDIREGGILYMRNCAMCHGDAQDGNGLFARVWQPKPSNFRDSGTIAQLGENYVFWRISEGGPGLPKGSIEYRSAMPVWGGVLTDDEIWKIIMFEYTSAGVTPARRD
jgi:cytochrome c5